MAAGKVSLENNTFLNLQFVGLNTASQAPQEIGSKKTFDFEDAPYGGVAYETLANQPAAKWIVAWKVTEKKVFTKILGGNETINWNDINDELDASGASTHTIGAFSLKSEVKIVQQNESVTISASLSRAQA